MNRSITIRIAMLEALRDMPEGFNKREDLLAGDIGRTVKPRPTEAEFQAAVRDAECLNYIVGTYNQGLQMHTWAITDAGKCFLAQI